MPYFHFSDIEMKESAVPSVKSVNLKSKNKAKLDQVVEYLVFVILGFCVQGFIVRPHNSPILTTL